MTPIPVWRQYFRAPLGGLQKRSPHSQRGRKSPHPGFYDRVLPPTEADRDAIRDQGDAIEIALRAGYGPASFLDHVSGEELRERVSFAPTCNIAGSKAAIPVLGSRPFYRVKRRHRSTFGLYATRIRKCSWRIYELTWTLLATMTSR